MTSQAPKFSDNCVEGDISAYIDGELLPADELVFERHVAQCAVCRSELNEQKLFLSAVNASLDSNEQINVPTNFTRTVVATAESKVSGLRDPQERSQAIWICSLILIVSVFAVGAESLGIFAKVASTAGTLGQFASSTFHLAMVSIAVAFRSLTAVAFSASPLVSVGVVAAAALLVFCCIRLLPKIHRSR